ncbi:MAG: hypothetical protein LBI18_09990 [Planctomycetaceae bacterium]|jgi:hypothetical protein|nr:hypothetical protein [Planctomycetaceae bacterium]
MPKKSAKKSATKAVKKSVKKVGRGTGAGRPKGSGKFGCPTKAIRVPTHLEQEIVEFALRKTKTKKNSD